jgi:aminoglycoside phosphotransferase (APT) family kinase protein
MKPTEETARDIIASHFRSEPTLVARFPTGLHHYVYDCRLSTGESVVVRIALLSEREAMAGALYWNKELRRLKVPLPRIDFFDLDFSFPYLVLERLPGKDIGQVIRSLSVAQMEQIAGELMEIQRQVGKVSGSGRFGYGTTPENAPHSNWTDVLRSSLNRSQARILAGRAVDQKFVDQVESWLESMAPSLDQQRAIPFLHDITTKNVIVSNGRMSGIVDVDSLCFGDPLFQIGLTKMALLSNEAPLDYATSLLRHYGKHNQEHLALYTAICCVDFMGEIGQSFNDLNRNFSKERKGHLEAIFLKIAGKI